MESLSIRRYAPPDAAFIARLSKDWADEQITLGYDGDHAWTEDRLRQCVTDDDPLFWVAEHANAVVGYVRGDIQMDQAQPAIPAGERYLKVRELYVTKALRSKGIGRELMAAIQTAAEQMGITRAQLKSANVDSAVVQRFYESLGYRVWYVQMYK